MTYRDELRAFRARHPSGVAKYLLSGVSKPLGWTQSVTDEDLEGDQTLETADNQTTEGYLSVDAYVRRWRITLKERRIAEQAVERVRAYRRYYSSERADRSGWDGIDAGTFIDGMMADAPDRRRRLVHSLTLKLAKTDGVDMTCRPYASDYREGVA